MRRRALLKGTPGLAVVLDSFEQRTQRPKRRQRAYDSGQKTAHTFKSPVAVDEETGRIVDVSDSVPGRTSNGWRSPGCSSGSPGASAGSGTWVRRNRHVAHEGVGRQSAPQAAWG
ncbi:MAG: hypothetical protein J0I06_09285 [Planctomycetes bacterium]|nr:hypothetical protein [Planctomycetota bacterium]